MFVERRQAKRLRCDLPSSFRDFDSVTSWSSSFASIKDISRGGLRLRTHSFVLLSDRLGISFKLPHSEKTIEARVSPAWISEIPNTQVYELGVRFTDLSDEARLAIEKYC